MEYLRVSIGVISNTVVKAIFQFLGSRILLNKCVIFIYRLSLWYNLYFGNVVVVNGLQLL
jgi:hypothetical protein